MRRKYKQLDNKITIKDLAKLREELSDLRFDALGSATRYVVLATDAIENALKWDVDYIREPLMAICRICVGEWEDEHIVDALNLCLLSFEQNYGELFKKVVNTRVKLISGITTKEENTVKPRLSESQYEHTDPIVAKTNTGRIVSIFPSSNISKRKSRISTIARRSF